MTVKVTNLGGGVSRLEICGGTATLPTSVVERIMADVRTRECSNIHRVPCHTPRVLVRELNIAPNDFVREVEQFASLGGIRPRNIWERPLPTPTPNREPDGIDIHVDRPLRSNYGGIPWAADRAFANDLHKYRSLEALAKECNWPAREPMKGAPVGCGFSHPLPQRISQPLPQRFDDEEWF